MAWADDVGGADAAMEWVEAVDAVFAGIGDWFAPLKLKTSPELVR